MAAAHAACQRMVKRRVKALDRLLAEGFFSDAAQAQAFVMSGAVACGGQPVRTGGQLVPADAPLTVRGLGERYVGKGGYKLEGALADFGVSAQGRVCLDAGACTGGFTDCLLQHGAARVYAVEVGFGQLAGSLAQDERVVNLERTNLGDPALTLLEPAPTLGVADLSYLSLADAVPLYRAIQRGQGELLCLVKPLFEVDSAQARRTGEVPDALYAPTLHSLIARLSAQPGTVVQGVSHSHVTGNNGTREFFLHVRFGEGSQPTLQGQVEAAVENALRLALYRKG